MPVGFESMVRCGGTGLQAPAGLGRLPRRRCAVISVADERRETRVSWSSLQQ